MELTRLKDKFVRLKSQVNSENLEFHIQINRINGKNLIDNGVEEKIPERTTPASFLQCRYFLFYFLFFYIFGHFMIFKGICLHTDVYVLKCTMI